MLYILVFWLGIGVGAVGLWWAIIHDDLDGGTRIVVDRWWAENELRWEGLRQTLIESNFNRSWRQARKDLKRWKL